MARNAQLLLAAGLAACVGSGGLLPGDARTEDVLRRLGEPSMSFSDADGATRLAFPRGPAGFETIMVDIDAAGFVHRVENVLDEEHFATIAAGMGKEQVLRQLGPPQPHWTVHFKARDELAWEWRYCDAWNAAARFSVLFDAASEKVRSTVSVRESCNVGDCLSAR